MNTQNSKNFRTAACSCGQLKAKVIGHPIRISICHCLAGQLRTGSAFGAQTRYMANNFTVEGESTEYMRTSDAGTKTRVRFCPNCGATVYYTLDNAKDVVAIPISTFADLSFPTPTFSVYEERMHSWVGLPKNCKHVA